jgi:hypothetical protein
MTKAVRFVCARSEAGLRYVFRGLLCFGYTSANKLRVCDRGPTRQASWNGDMGTVRRDHEGSAFGLRVALGACDHWSRFQNIGTCQTISKRIISAEQAFPRSVSDTL